MVVVLLTQQSHTCKRDVSDAALLAAQDDGAQ